MTAEGNVADTGIVEEANQLIADTKAKGLYNLASGVQTTIAEVIKEPVTYPANKTWHFGGMILNDATRVNGYDSLVMQYALLFLLTFNTEHLNQYSWSCKGAIPANTRMSGLERYSGGSMNGGQAWLLNLMTAG